MLANIGYSGRLNGTFAYDRSGQTSRKLSGKRENFTEELAIRLQNVQVESCDALRIIRSRDTESSFFYCDPPYIGTDCGHYDGYSAEDFDALLSELSEIKGQFLLSSFRSAILRDYSQKQKWQQIEIKMGMPVAKGKQKIEVLTANYPINL